MTRIAPNRDTPRVEAGKLFEGDKEIAVDSEEWFAWLEGAQRFYVVHPLGNFSCRKEYPARGGRYWSAYRRLQGKTARAYIGLGPLVTAAKLEEVAENLARHLEARIEPTPEKLVPAKRLRVPLNEVLETIERSVALAEQLAEGQVVDGELAQEAAECAEEGRNILRKHGKSP